MTIKRLVVLIGKAGAGKDTSADFLVADRGFTKLALADPLKEMSSFLFRYPTVWNYTREGKEKTIPLTGGMTVGRALQLLGTDCIRTVFPTIWCDLLIERAKDTRSENVVVSDCRFTNEVGYFLGLESIGIDVTVIFLTRTSNQYLAGRDKKHQSEAETNLARTMFETHPRFTIIDNSHKKFPLETLKERVLSVTWREEDTDGCYTSGSVEEDI